MTGLPPGGDHTLIDAQVSVWSRRYDPRLIPPSWLPAAWRSRTRTVRLDEIERDMTSAGVTHLVLVQTTNALGHTDELLTAAASSARPARVVGWVPVTDPAATASALRRYTHQHALAGVRHRILEHENPVLLLEDSTARCLDLLAQTGLVLDILPWPTDVLAQVPRIARRHPGLPIVIDLMGWPDVQSGRMQPWTDHLAAAAGEPNVHLKVAGLHRMTAQPADLRSWRPYLMTAVEVFGAERIMIGSDWPAAAMYGRGYTDAIRAAADAFSDLTPAERGEVYAGTARRVYGFAAAAPP